MKILTDVEFVKVWQSSNNRQEVADACGISGAAAGMRAAKLRRSGVNLKIFQRGRPRKTPNVNALNDLIDSLG